MVDNLVEIDHFNRVDFDAFTQARGNPGGKEITWNVETATGIKRRTVNISVCYSPTA